MYVVRLRDPIEFLASDARPVCIPSLDDAAIVCHIALAIAIKIDAKRNFPDREVDIFDLQKKAVV